MSGSTGLGITVQGFVMPQLTDIQTSINQTLQSRFGAGINLLPRSFFGQISGIFSEREYLIWAAMQDTYKSQNPNEAFGASLDNVGSLRGILRLGPLPSKIKNVKLFGTVGTTIPATTTQFSVQNAPTSIFSLDSSVTLVAGANCVQLITFSTVPTAGTWTITLGGTTTTTLAYNATAADVQAAVMLLEFAAGCTVTGDYTSGFTVTFNGAGTGGLMIQPAFVVSSALTDVDSIAVTSTVAITTAGVDQAQVTVTATTDGPIVANTGTLTVIATPISGLTAVLNYQDAVVGQLVEEDNAYRIRMEQELQIAGAGTVEAIRSKLLQVSGVTNVLVFENVSDIPDSNGRYPHSFECVVSGGDPAEIAETIWLAKPAGIPTFGNTSFTITDSQGQTHVIYYSTPYAVPVFIIANITKDSSYPADGDAQVKLALATYGNGLGIGQELIVVPKLISQLVNIQGIQDVVLLVGIAPAPTSSDNINPEPYQELTFDTGRIEVNS